MKLTKLILSTVGAGILLVACNKDDEYNPNVKAEVAVEFDNVAGTANIQLNTGVYTNAAGQNFSITKLKYFVSNIEFTKTDGTVYTVPQNDCYFLIDESVSSSHEPKLMIPEGEYKTVSFILGVDSLRNTKDVSQRTGALDVSGVASDMYWSWNSGYIFFKMDGTSPASTSPGNIFQYHVGGFGGYSTPTTNNLRKINIDLSARGIVKVKAGKETTIHLLVDVLKAISGSTNLNFATSSMIHSPTAASVIANNYTSMFSHDHTHN